MENKWSLFIKQNLDSFLLYRKESMGIAMIMVVFYHLKTTLFYPGFLGVDIFLFLSAYGLCLSYKRNSLLTFYKHRAKRIVPVFLLLGFFANVVFIFLYHYDLNVWDFFCNVTSLNYWKLGGKFFEWYLCFLIVLYVLFPIVYVIIIRGRVISFALITALSILFLTCGLDWYYDTAIGRIPIFCLGIIYYQAKESNNMEDFKKCSILFAIAFVVSVVLFIKHHIHLYVMLYMAAPILLVIVGWFVHVIKHQQAFATIANFIGMVGQYTLEIYAANVLVCLYRKSPDSIFMNQPTVVSVTLYFVMNIVLALLFVGVNNRIMYCYNT